jgi:tRNA pseudouridine13 synthase
VKAPIPDELRRGYLTSAIPAVPCEVRATPEDFRVEEVPLYEPCGEGEHLYLRIEKRGISTDEAMRRIAQRLDVPRRAIGHAGLKDARAVTVQTLSVQGVAEARSIDDGQLKLLEAKRHKNKLKVGHLAGNRFLLRLRGAGPHEANARAALDILARRGVANYFGLQRFGNERTTHRLGEALVREEPKAFVDLLIFGSSSAAPSDAEPLEEDEETVAPRPRGRDAQAVFDARAAARAGDLERAAQLMPRSFAPEQTALRMLSRGRSPADAARSVPNERRSFYAAAFQSFLFNAYLTRRLERLDHVEQGEVVTLHRNGASFVVEDAVTDEARCATFELSPSGPLFGHKLLRPAEGSAPRADEEAVLSALAPGLGPELTQALGARPRGERRPLRIPLREPKVEVDGQDLLLGFFLPRGSYATAVLEELRKEQTD